MSIKLWIIEKVGIFRIAISLFVIFCIYSMFSFIMRATVSPPAFFSIPLSSKNAPTIPRKDSILELKSREYLELTTGLPFSKVRMVKNPITGKNLEYDCYNESLKLAFEIQGEQHYKFIPYFHSTKDKFTLQQYRDEIKRNESMKMGIKLVEIPYHSIKNDQYKNIIDKALEEYKE